MLISWLQKNISIRFLINIIILLFLQVFVANKILIHGRFEWYFQDMFSLNLLRVRVVQVFAIFVIMLLALNYVPIKQNTWLHKWNWSAFEHGKGLRILVMICVFILTWAFASYSFNYFYNQPHYFDRILLVVLALLVYVNPIFAIPFTMIAYVISYQFSYPIGFSYTDKQMLFEFVALFGIYVALRPFTRGRTRDFIFIALCMIAAYYYFPGIEKLNVATNSPINWIWDNNLHNYIPFTYEQGWLAFRSQELVYTMTDIVAFFRVPFQIFTVVVEIGLLFIVSLKRRGTVVILILAILLHTGIWISTGIFFWMWIGLDGAMAWFIWRYGDREEIAYIFKPIPMALSLVIIASGSLFFDVIHLGWWNSPIHTYYRFDVIDTQGDRYDFSYSQLQPYDFVLTQNRLYYINKDKTITGSAGESDIGTFLASVSLELNDVPAFIEEFGKNRYDAASAERLKELLRVSAYNMNLNYRSTFIPSLIPAPLHIESQLRDDSYNFAYPISELHIRAIVSFYDGDKIHIISDKVVSSLSITVPEELLDNP